MKQGPQGPFHGDEMGDRICIKLTDGERTSPTFYGHWVGTRALKVMNRVTCYPNNGIGNLMCNFISKVMEGMTYEYSHYIMNDGEADGAADWDNGTWTYDTRDGYWRTDLPKLKGLKFNKEEVDMIADGVIPCLYEDCPCWRRDEKGCIKDGRN